MGKDDLPAFPTPKETFGSRQGSSAGYIPPPPQHRYGPQAPQQTPPPQQYAPTPQQYAPPPPQQHHAPPPPQQHHAPPPPPAHPQQPYRPHPQGQQYHAPPPPPPPAPHPPQPQPQQPYYQAPGPPPSPHQQQQPPQHHRPPPSPYYNGYNSTPPAAVPNRVASNPSPRSSSPATNLSALFKGVDRNGNGTLSESELGSALVNGDYTKFNPETVKLMIKMFDRNNDGAIDFEEFGNLWRYLRDWRKIFDKFDLDKNGSIDYDEYVRAMTAFGYSLSNPTIQYMYNTYSHRDRWGERAISFDMFVQSCINLKRITDSFKKFDVNRDGYITVGFEQYLTEVLSLR